MKALENLNIKPTANMELEEMLQYNLDQKAKPVGSLGQLERLAKQIGMIQQTTTPELGRPVMLTVASDHAITEEKVSPVPTDITWQQCLNFAEGGGGIGLFCEEMGFDLFVVDAGVNYDFETHPKIIDKKVRKWTRNFLHEPAMTTDECNQALQNGRDVVAGFAAKGVKVIGFGEMGIGNTSPATALLSAFANVKISDVVGPGCGLDKGGVSHKAKVLQEAMDKHGVPERPEDILATYGGLEIATIAGGMLEAAAQGMVVMVDGFITTSAYMAAYAINPQIADYAILAHSSKEPGHSKMVEYVGAEPILDLGFRLGEGTGVAAAFPLVKLAVAMLNKMTSFAEAKVYNTSDIRCE